jgi:leucyl aminopeptidase
VAYSAGFALAKRLAARRRDRVAVVLPPSDDPPLFASALVEGAIVGTSGPGVRKSEASRHAFESLSVVVGTDLPDELFRQLEQTLRRAEVVGQAVNLARDLVNTPPADKSPRLLAERVGKVAVDAGLSVEIWDEARIRHERFGGLLGVAAGSDEPPRFVVLDYRNGEHHPPLALVGKGVTFDSGGLSLKPSASMEDMKSDMTGAAVVVAAIQAAARLALPVNITGYLAITENMTGGRAMKLGDVLTMRNGKTVEIMNTDAEGRLILADALSYAVEQQPDRVLDLATLTGACMVALGPKIAGLFGNDEDFREDVIAASRRTGERAWPLPLDDDFKEQLKSHVADCKNVGGKWGGAITAAKFLEQFAGSTPWVHLDIAGPSWSDSDNATRDAGGTGCFVRTLVALFEQMAIDARQGQMP